MDLAIARRKLIENVIIPSGVVDTRVLDLMGTMPRHFFVPEGMRSRSYEDNSIPIGHNQTISKPSIVARMIQGAGVMPHDTVLEIGTGSGYQTALLSCLAKWVYSMDIIPDFIQRVQPILDSMELGNIQLSVGDGHLGLPLYQPFDVIILSAWIGNITPTLLKQLHPEGGRLVAPVKMGNQQRIRLYIRSQTKYHQVDLGLCHFVPMVREKPRKHHSLTQDDENSSKPKQEKELENLPSSRYSLSRIGNHIQSNEIQSSTYRKPKYK